MTTNSPLISIIITVYNGELYIRESIDSVLEQTWDTLEVIVIDDGSSDGTAMLIADYDARVTYHYQTNQGAGLARNTGVSLAKGQYLAFHDADDLFTKERLELQMNAFAKEPKIDIVFGHMQQFLSPELDKNSKRKFNFHTEIMLARLQSGMLIKKCSFLNVGLFDTYQIAQGVDWFMRAQEANLVSATIDDIVSLRRIHERNHGILHRNDQTDRLRVLKAALDRRRLANK